MTAAPSMSPISSVTCQGHVASEGVDFIVGSRAAVAQPDRRDLVTRFEDGERTLPQRANLFADLSAMLPEHQGVFVTSDAGPGTADTRTSQYAKPIRHANYLLVSDPTSVKRFDAPAMPEVSDHRLLFVEI